MVNKSKSGTSAQVKIVYRRCKVLFAGIPLISVTGNGWQYATEAFAANEKKYRRKQQWKSFFSVVAAPRFASEWFEILKSSDLASVINIRKETYLKPFRVYMSARWTKRQKIKVIQDTYRFIATSGGILAKAIAIDCKIDIARFNLENSHEAVLSLGYDYRYRKEGELVLFFSCEKLGGIIAAARFSFEELSTGHWACRIACIQGHQLQNANPSKTIQKLLHGMRPKSLLIFTLQALSRELGCCVVYGAGDSIQAYRQKHFVHLPWRHSIKFDYNAVWKESGGHMVADGWFELPLNAARRNVTEIKTHKRAVYHRRYELLDSLIEKIASSVNYRL